MTDEQTNPTGTPDDAVEEVWTHEAVEAFDTAFLAAHGPLPPAARCPISWQPAALTPVFYGARDLDATDGAPVPLRIFFPSLDGAVFSAPVLAGCGRYPLVVFAHGHCQGDANHYRRWFVLPAQLARAGYVVVVPHLAHTAAGTHPSAPNHPDVATIRQVVTWARQTWEHRDVLLGTASTAVVGHSYGAMVAARYATESGVRAYAGISGTWQDWSGGPLPITGVQAPTLLVWGGPDDQFTQLADSTWNSLPRPRHRAVFASGLHFDYLPAGQSPCDPERGPCRFIGAATTDLVTMFLGRYLPPELATDLPGRIPSDLRPPALVLTPEQEFYAGSYLRGVAALHGRPGCGLDLAAALPTDRTVPHVRFLPRQLADARVRQADLVPRFTGSGTWVTNQSPVGGRVVSAGSTVSMSLRSGPIP